MIKRDIHPALAPLLHDLTDRFGSRQLIADAVGVQYSTVAHWFDGRSMPNFDITVKILTLLGKIDG